MITFCLTRLFESFGKPTTILANNGTNYLSKQLRKFFTERGIRIVFSLPYRQEKNGLCEKTNDTLITGIRLVLTDKPKLKWTSALELVLMTINDRPHDVTGFSPRFLHLGTTIECQPPPTLSLKDARRLATERSGAVQKKRAVEHAARDEHISYDVEDLVKFRLASNYPTRNKFTPCFGGSCRLVERIGHETYVLDELDDISGEPIRRLTLQASRLAKYYVKDVTEIGVHFIQVVHENEYRLYSCPLDDKFSRAQDVITRIRDVFDELYTTSGYPKLDDIDIHTLYGEVASTFKDESPNDRSILFQRFDTTLTNQNLTMAEGGRPDLSDNLAHPILAMIGRSAITSWRATTRNVIFTALANPVTT